MSLNFLALLGHTVLAMAVLLSAQMGAASASASTMQSGQTEKATLAQPVQVEQLADAGDKAKDDGDNDDDDGNDDDDDDDDDKEAKKLPKSVSTAVFKDLMQRTGAKRSTFRVVSIAKQTWGRWCLGISREGVGCTQAVVPGYQVVVLQAQQYWVYRTNESGSAVVYDEVASKTIAQQSNQQVTTQTQTTTTTSSTSATQVSFTDVSSTYWASSFITELARLTIVEGFPDGTFRPNDVLTKAQFAAVMSKAFEQTKTRNAIAFRDVSESYWAYNAIRETYETGWLGVSASNEFAPTRSLTRFDVLVTLARVLNYTTTTSSVNSILAVYQDAASIPTNYRTSIAALTERGVMVNYPNSDRLELTRTVTRSEVTAFLYQALASVGKVQTIASPYVIKKGLVETGVTEGGSNSRTNLIKKQNCNQGIGNGAEGCDPGNSRPRGGSNDEGGRTPGNK
jgi:hypothetical protein